MALRVLPIERDAARRAPRTPATAPTAPFRAPDPGRTAIAAVLPPRPRIAWGMKRTLDISVAVIGLAVLAPLFALIALLVLLDSGRPVFFCQKRVGRNGSVFCMWKFRTMVVDAESRLGALEHDNEANGPFFKMTADPRVTRLGRWLRATCLDELPQLVNVATGKMSLVGPRPFLPEELDQEPWVFEWRLPQLPGITGLWQVSGRSALAPHEGVELDRRYAEHWSLVLDLSILVRTVGVVRPMLRETCARARRRLESSPRRRTGPDGTAPPVPEAPARPGRPFGT